MDIFHFVDHGLVDLAEVKIDGRAQHAQVANNSGLGVLLQLLIYLIFNSSMGGDKMTFFHASQIGNTGNNSAGVLLVLCCTLIPYPFIGFRLEVRSWKQDGRVVFQRVVYK